jgi:ATP-dependent RNA helicase RhlE
MHKGRTLSPFAQFGLSEPILKALVSEGYTQPTPIQTQAIPQVMTGRDLCGIAQTGTGKTAAFALPILERLAKNPRPLVRKGCRTLVLSPTRELATQIADSFRTYGRHLRLSTMVVFGGVPVPRQERQLAGGVDILVATPGRLLDLIDRRSLSLREVEILVLDEADQMLDLGFIHDLKRIVKLLPAKRQSLFFSATMPKTIASLADQFLTDPTKVAVAPVATTVERVEQQVMFVSSGQKQALLANVLQDDAIERVLVFTRTKHGADKVVRYLDQAGIRAAAIHGNKSQPQRERALAAFRAGTCRVLVATDIAARGIDVDGVTHVINFDLPNVPESYVHRIGRTARAGAAGMAISFCNDEERAYLRDIERLTRLRVPVAATPAGFASLAPSAPVADERRPSPGRRGSGRGPSDQRSRQPNRQPHQPAKAEARHSADDASSKKKRRRRRRPQTGAGAGAPAHVPGSAHAPALPGFVLNSARDRRAQPGRSAR